MEWSKVKNIILVILALTNVVLLAFVLHREVRDQRHQQQARADAIVFLKKNGITAENSVVPSSMELLPMQVDRALDNERQIAAALLGEDMSVQARGGEVYRYESPLGWLQFHSDGAFQGEFSPGAFLLEGQTQEEHAEEMLRRLGFIGQVLDGGKQAAGGVTVRQAWENAPVFNLQVTAEYEADSLVRFTAGRRLFGQPAVLMGSQPMTVATALVKLMTGLNELGDVCSRIDGITPGYVSTASLSGTMTLNPVWRIATDTGGYQLDIVTGVLSRI